MKEMSIGTTELDPLEIDSINISFRNKRGDVCGIINVRVLKSKDRVQIIASQEVKEYLFSIEN
jgi:pyruvate kinase